MASLRHKYMEMNEDLQAEITKERLEKTKDNGLGPHHGNMHPNKQLNSSGYFSQDNVKEYQKKMVTHLFGKDAPKKRGRGTFFESEEEINQWILQYFELCMETEVVPTVSGLATYLKTGKQTLYDHANNPNSPLHNSCRQALEYCHVCLETGASESKINSVAYIFQAKNYFGMKDTQEIQVQANATQELNSADTLQALKEQKQQELNAPTSIDMRDAVIIEEKIKDEIQNP